MGKQQFFEAMDRLGLALTFDGVRLKSGHSDVVPAKARVETMFSRRVGLKCPIVSAAMDTVTESQMAIALAKAGGIGVIHRKLDPKDQAAEVARVKHYLHGRIDRPICADVDETIESILRKRGEKRYPFHSFPVIDSTGKLKGILTKNDFELCPDQQLPARSVMTQDVITAPAGTGLPEAYEIMVSRKKKLLPLVDVTGKIVGLYVFSDVRRIRYDSSSTHNVDAEGHLRVAAAVGTGESALERAALLVAEAVDVIVIDTAHGDSAPVYETLKALKDAYPGTDIVVGNVSEGESAKRLVEAGADGIKVGQGGGSICTTRIISGVGCPQVTAIYNCAGAIEGSQIPICADGGIRNSGDITIAIGAGAHSVMLGKLLAGTDEAPGELIVIKGIRYKKYRGMGSLGAMLSSRESRDRYRQEGFDDKKPEIGRDKLVPEGVEGIVPYQGPVERLMYQYLGGLRSGMGYVGAGTIEGLRQKADFRRISSDGLAESHPHDIIITEDAPNYRRNNSHESATAAC